MPELPPRLFRNTLAPAGCFVFFLCLLLSSISFYRGKPFDPKLAVISDLQSPEQNPGGYRIASAGSVISGVLFVPVTVLFYGQFRVGHRKSMLTGAILSTAGLGAMIAIGVLAPFTAGYSWLHIQLAYVAFLGICSGTACLLIAVKLARAFAAFQCVVFLVLVFLYFVPDFFVNDRLITSLALWEWMLSLNCGFCLLILTRISDEQRRKEL